MQSSEPVSLTVQEIFLFFNFSQSSFIEFYLNLTDKWLCKAFGPENWQKSSVEGKGSFKSVNQRHKFIFSTTIA